MAKSIGEHSDPLTHAIIGAAIRVRKVLGCGLLESAYETFLCHELGKLNLRFAKQTCFPVIYDGIRVEVGFRADVIVEDAVIVEVKAVSNLSPRHKAQLLTYMRLSGIRLGLLLDFNAIPFSTGITRLVL